MCTERRELGCMLNIACGAHILLRACVYVISPYMNLYKIGVTCIETWNKPSKYALITITPFLGFS